MWLIDRIVRTGGDADGDPGTTVFRWALTFVFFAGGLAGYAVADAVPEPGDGMWMSPALGAAAIAGLWTIARGGFFPRLSKRSFRPPRAIHLTMLASDIGRIEGIDVLSYAAATRALEEIGFEWRGDYRVPEVGGAIFRLLMNAEVRAYAELIALSDYEQRLHDEFFEHVADGGSESPQGAGAQPAYPVIVSHFVDGTALFTTAFPFDPCQGLAQECAWTVENFRLLAQDPKELLEAHLARRREMVREGRQLRTHVSERVYRDAMNELYWRATHAARMGRGSAEVKAA